ncbi:recombinase family protein [Streptomyces sediminimaris]|uniref:recombinase family protein n=1 Tax=Streptomyces sediminimaris TaxID=3383721 RepID=UPI00399C03A7
MRAALYARVSTERQQARGTIGSQLAVLREHVAAAGDEAVAEFIDDGCSGARLDRPGLDALRDAARPGCSSGCGACPRTGSPAPTPTRSLSLTTWHGCRSRWSSPMPRR